MKLQLNERDINLKEENGMYSFRINSDVKCENIPTKEEALKHAEKLLMKLIRQIIKK